MLTIKDNYLFVSEKGCLLSTTPLFSNEFLIKTSAFLPSTKCLRKGAWMPDSVDFTEFIGVFLTLQNPTRRTAETGTAFGPVRFRFDKHLIPGDGLFKRKAKRSKGKRCLASFLTPFVNITKFFLLCLCNICTSPIDFCSKISIIYSQ